jgi:hypothetical protein
MKRIGFFLILFALFSSLSAQESYQISKPEVSFSNNILIIKYDITGCGSNEYVNVRLIALDSKGDTLKPVFISGNVGKMVSCGLGKSIIWNLEKDNIKISGDISVFLIGEKYIPTVNYGGPKKLTRGNIILSSVIVPGLGQKKASGKPIYFIFSGLVYGSGATSLYFTFRSASLKKDYLDAEGAERDNLYNKWQKSYDMSKYFAYGAAGTWAINFIWSALIPKKVNASKKMDVSISSLRQNEFLLSAKWKF